MPGGGRGTVVIFGMWSEPEAAEAGVTLQQPEAHPVFSWGSCPWIWGPWQWHAARLPGAVCVCGYWPALVHRILGGCSSINGSCPSLGSELLAMAVPVSGGSLGGAPLSVGRQGSNPLSSHNMKQRSLASLAGPDFSPDSFLANCGALAPFRLSSRSQPQSSPWGLTSKAWASAPSPHPSWWVSREASQADECWSAPILCAGIFPLCPPHPCCCALLRGSEASPPPTPLPHQWRGSLLCGNFSSFTAPSLRCRSRPYSFVSVFSFFFCPTQGFPVWGFSWAFGKSEAFCQRSVGVL